MTGRVFNQRWCLFLFYLLSCTSELNGAVLVCPKCGYENVSGRRTCIHCGASLVMSGESEESESGSQKQAKAAKQGDVLNATMVGDEINQAMKCFREEDFEVARLFFKMHRR